MNVLTQSDKMDDILGVTQLRMGKKSSSLPLHAYSLH